MNFLKGLVAGAAASALATAVDYALREYAPSTRRRDGAPRYGTERKAVGGAVRKAGVEASDRQQDLLAMGMNVLTSSFLTAAVGKVRRNVTHEPPGIMRAALLGVGTFILFEELIKPTLGGYAKPTDSPWPVHARRFAGHMTHRVANAGMRRLLDFEG